MPTDFGFPPRNSTTTAVDHRELDGLLQRAAWLQTSRGPQLVRREPEVSKDPESVAAGRRVKPHCS